MFNRYKASGCHNLSVQVFLVKEGFAIRGAVLIIPAFTKGHKQLPASDVDQSRAMSSVRVSM